MDWSREYGISSYVETPENDSWSNATTSTDYLELLKASTKLL
jgi:hypothetical protein